MGQIKHQSRRQRQAATKADSAVTGNGASEKVILPATPPEEPKKIEAKDVDRRMIGYQFPGYLAGPMPKTPLDFKVDPQTGCAKGNQSGLWGIATHDLTKGVNPKVTLPPLAIWEKGRYLDDFEWEFEPIWDCHPHGGYDKRINWDKRVYIVSGEGSPGLYAFRAYLLPLEIAQESDPKHPLLWKGALKKSVGSDPSFVCDKRSDWLSAPDDPFLAYHVSWQLLKKGKLIASELPPYPEGYKRKAKPPTAPKQTALSGGLPEHGGWGHGVRSTPAPAAPKAVQAPALPAGVRFQCPSCGHWWKESDLAAHSKVCAGIHGTDGATGWALMCDKECGCEFIAGFPSERHQVGFKTLDHVSRCKPGFIPIVTKEVKMSETTETPAADTAATDTPATEEETPTAEETKTEATEEATTTA